MLLSALSSVELRQGNSSEASESSSEVRATQEEASQPEPSQKAALTALFGWSLLPPTESRPATPSAMPASSISHAEGISSVTRRSSLNSSSISEAGSPRPSRIPVPRSSTVTSRLHRQEATKKRDDILIHCALCQRRVGLWAFKNSDAPAASSQTISSPNPAPTPITDGSSRLPVRRVSQGSMPKRQFDLLKEHRSYCPYVVKSTVVPSLTALARPSSPPRSASASHTIHYSRPSPTRTSSGSSFNFSSLRGKQHSLEQNGSGGLGDPAAVEGWRAVLTMVIRTGVGRRQRERALANVHGSRSSSDTGMSEVRQERETASLTSPTGTEVQQEQSSESMEIDAIQAMVEDVKKRGVCD